MFTVESRLFLTTTVAGFALAVTYLIGTHDRMGAALFFGVAVAGLLATLRSVDIVPAPSLTPPPPRLARPERAPRATPWPIVAAVGLALLLAGVVVDTPLMVLGTATLGVAGAGWLAETWRDHLDRTRPEALLAAERVVFPAGVPLLALVGIAATIISFSRILLALPEKAATAAALAAAMAVLVAMATVATRPVRAPVLLGVASVAALAVVIGGVVAAGVGERTFEGRGVAPVRVVAKGTAFKLTSFTLPARSGVEIRFDNRDPAIQHNISLYSDAAGTKPIYQGDAVTGPGSADYRFITPGPGTYLYRCDFHPTAMKGTVQIR